VVVVPVLSLVTAKITPERQAEVTGPYRDTVAAGLPPGLRQTFLLVGDDDTLAIATVWSSREALDAMRASGEEPFARRVLREAGGEPEIRFFEIEAEAAEPGGA
jgi:heme-degrading monooxygenase HmoA